MAFENIRYVSSVVEFEKYRTQLKSVPCPHCHSVGNLNRHGSLRGYGDQGSEKVQRGWRILCSNRYRRKGCGHTYSVLLADFLKRRIVTASRLWKFLEGILSGLSIKTAWEKIAPPFCLEYGYRLWRKFRDLQSEIRSLLCRKSDPKLSSLKNPFLQTLQHLQNVFSSSSCPISAFQIHFQQPFLG